MEDEILSKACSDMYNAVDLHTEISKSLDVRKKELSCEAFYELYNNQVASEQNKGRNNSSNKKFSVESFAEAFKAFNFYPKNLRKLKRDGNQQQTCKNIPALDDVLDDSLKLRGMYRDFRVFLNNLDDATQQLKRSEEDFHNYFEQLIRIRQFVAEQLGKVGTESHTPIADRAFSSEEEKRIDILFENVKYLRLQQEYGNPCPTIENKPETNRNYSSLLDYLVSSSSEL